MQNSFTRMMIEVAVDKALGEIRKKSKRALRNLADLGMHYAKGRFQDEFFTIAQHMLEDDNSPYYDMFFHLANNVDPKMLKKFGINLGYNSWTLGAKTIRKWEREHGYHVPWTVVFDWAKSQEPLPSSKEMERNISQAKEMGIFCYMFFIGENEKALNQVLELAEANDDCAILCFCEATLMTQEVAGKLRKRGNVMPVINVSEDRAEAIQSACHLLMKNKCLYSLSALYDDQNVPYIIQECSKSQKREACAFVFFIQKDGCSAQAAAQMHEFVDEGQENPQNTLFPMDFYQDISHVDRTISMEDCYLEMRAHDRALCGTQLIEFGEGMSFRTFLQTYMPKAQWE